MLNKKLKIHRGFTLIEILVALMLTGMLTTLALAPVVVTVRRVVDIQNEYSDLSALSRTMNFIARDLSSAMRMSQTVILIRDHESLGGNDDDTLVIMSTSLVAQDLPAGSLVYKIDEGGITRSNVIPGLYRWIFPGKQPTEIDLENLSEEDSQLVLPGVTGFCVEVPGRSFKDDRRKEYRGALPVGIYIKISRRENDGFPQAYSFDDDEEENLDELENFIVFP